MERTAAALSGGLALVCVSVPQADPEMPTGRAESRWVPVYLGWFPAVHAGYWAGTAIQACQRHDVVQRYPDGFYRPTATVTRARKAVYIARAFGLDGELAPLRK